MSIKTLEVWQCDNAACGKVAPYGALPDGWVWGMVTLTKKRPDPKKHGETIDVPYKDERSFCSEACAKAFEKSTHLTIERPKVADATA